MEGRNQPADKSLINRRLSLRSQFRAANAFLADGLSAARALNRASPLDREHKRAGRLRAIEAIKRRMVDIPQPAGANVKRVDVGPEVCLSTVPCGR